MGLFNEYTKSKRTADRRLNQRLALSTFNTGLLAARKLNEFFNGRSGQTTDIKADRFGPFPAMGRPLAEGDKIRIDQQLAHLTQPGEQSRLESINLDMIALPVWKRCQRFCEYILDDYLKPGVQPDEAMIPEAKRVLSYVSSYLARIEGRLPPPKGNN